MLKLNKSGYARTLYRDRAGALYRDTHTHIHRHTHTQTLPTENITFAIPLANGKKVHVSQVTGKQQNFD